MPKCDFVPSHLRALCMHNLFKVGKIIKIAVILKKNTTANQNHLTHH